MRRARGCKRLTASLKDLRILIVEDESMISMLIEDMLTDMGCAIAGTASQLQDATAKVASLAFDAAILDVNLNGSQTWPVAQALTGRRIPFVISTGYGAAGVPDAFAEVPILGKPFDANELERALRAALDRA